MDRHKKGASTPNVGNSVDEVDRDSNHNEIRDWTTHWVRYSRERKRKLRKRKIENRKMVGGPQIST